MGGAAGKVRVPGHDGMKKGTDDPGERAVAVRLDVWRLVGDEEPSGKRS